MTDLFLKIVNMSISATYLVLAVIALRLLLKKAPKWVNVLLWGLVAVRLLCPFTLESALSLIPSAEVLSPEIMTDPTPTIHTGIEAVNSAVNPMIAETFAPEPAASANPLQIWFPIFSAVWLIGMGLMLLYTLVTYQHLRRQVKMAIRVKDNIYLSEFVSSPFVLGVFRPKIYLPYHMNEQDRTHVLAHERTHIRRKDHWWKPMGFLLLTIHWFNPAMWAAYILLCRDIELACDEKVIKELGTRQRADYSQALLNCSIDRKSIAACPVAFGEVGVKERVKNVLNYKKPAFWVILISVILCGVVAVCFLTSPMEATPFGQTYDVDSVTYTYGSIVRLEQTPYYALTENGQLKLQPLQTDSYYWEHIGTVSEITLTEENFDKLFQFQFEEENGPLSVRLRESNEKAWGLIVSPDLPATAFYYVLLQENGDIYLVEGQNRPTSANAFIRHIFQLEEADLPLPAEVEETEPGEILTKVYVYRASSMMEDACSIALYSDGTFVLHQSLLSSYYAQGTYQLDEQELQLHTADGVKSYFFSVNGEAFLFDASRSSTIDMTTEDFALGSVPDGAAFCLEAELSEPELTSSVHFSVQDVTPTGATIVFPNELPIGMYYCGASYTLQSLTDGEWIDLAPIIPESEISWNETKQDITLILAQDIHWQELYGALPEGQYRIGKTIYQNKEPGGKSWTLYAEFSITAPAESPYAVTSAIPGTGLFGSAEYLTPGDITGYTFFPEQEEELAAILRSLTQEDFVPAVGITPITKFTLSWKGGEVILYTDGVQVEFGEDAQWAVEDAELNQFLSQFQQGDYSYENYDDIPLDKIPEHYSLEEATIDKCVIIVDGDARDNQDVWEEFTEAADRGETASVRIAEYSSDSHSMKIYDLSCNSEAVGLDWYQGGAFYMTAYRYMRRFTLTGTGDGWDECVVYLLTDHATASYEEITGGELLNDYEEPMLYHVVYTDLIYYPDHPAIPTELTSAALEMDGKRFLTITDPATLSELSSMFSNAELMWEPKTYNLGPVLTLTDAEGKTCQIELDVADDLCRIDGQFYDYGPGYNENGGNFALPDLWELLGLSNWPQSVLEKYADYLGYTP